MIELCEYRSITEKNLYLEQQDLEHTTLVVSDLSSKLFWQDFLLAKHKFISGPQVYRAEDLWTDLVNKTSPEIEFVSHAWINSYLKKNLTVERTSTFGLPFASPSTTIKAMNELMPILAHPDSIEIMENWFEDSLKTKCHWKPWFFLCENLWNELQLKKRILTEWSAAFLLQISDFEKYWHRDLIIDLGPEIRTIEVELLQTLSSTHRVRVLVPKPKWIQQFRWVEYPYNIFYKQNHQIVRIELNSPLQIDQLPEVSTQTAFKRFSAPLAEVKFVIGQIRQWLEKGIDLSQMAVIAPDIEDYWPTLRWHLKKEGIPFEKSETIKIGSLGVTIAWIALLKKLTGTNLKSSEFELAEFHPLNHQSSQFLIHQTLWTKKPIQLNSDKLELENLVDAEAFIIWATETWRHSTQLPDCLLEICKLWLIEARALGENSYRFWIEYLEDYLKIQELTLQPKTPLSLGLYSLMNGLPRTKQFLVFLGCSESQLKSPSGFVSGSEVLSLQFHTGHLLAHPDRDFKEYQLNIFYGQTKVQIFTFAQSDFKGTDLVPSIFWLNGRDNKNSSIHELDGWQPNAWEFSESENVITDNEDANQKINLDWNFTLSPASLQSYVSCPFRFFAEKGLKLVDPSIVDLDLDPRTKGSLQHRLLELLTPEPFNVSHLRETLATIVEQTLESQQQMFYSPKTKELIRMQLFELGLRFLEHEEIYRKEFPRFYTLAKEAWFKKEIKISDRTLIFRGKIDRIDLSTDHQEAIVLDYKSDITNYRNANSWIDNLEFQLLAYTDSVESGCAEVEPKKSIVKTKVIAAHYYSLKDFKRKGFTLAECSEGVVETPTAKSKMNNEEKNSLLTEFHSILEETTQKIISGDFRAIPHPKTDCKKCPWRTLCRAPRQNL